MRGEFALIERYFRRRFAATADGDVTRRGASCVDGSAERDAPAQGIASSLMIGIGDDAALWRGRQAVQVASVDTQVLGRHWFPGCPPAVVAWRALAAAASDLAAMGARPTGCLLALTLPDAQCPDPVWTLDSRTEHDRPNPGASGPESGADFGVMSPWLEGFAEGFWQAATAFAVPLLGGDTTRGPLAVSITVLGERPESVRGPWGEGLTPTLRRCDARPGDELWVGGALGGAALGLQCLERERALQSLARTPGDTPPAIARWCWPRPRIALGLRLLQRSGRGASGGPQGRVGAAIDISDGLMAEALHLACRSGVVVEIDIERVPVAMPSVSRSSPASPPMVVASGQRESPDTDGPDPGLDDSVWVQAWLAALTGGEDYELLWTAEPGFDASGLPCWDDDLALRSTSPESTGTDDAVSRSAMAWRASPKSVGSGWGRSAPAHTSATRDRCGPLRIGRVLSLAADGPGVGLSWRGRRVAFWGAHDEVFRRHPELESDSRLRALLDGLEQVGFDHFAPNLDAASPKQASR